MKNINVYAVGLYVDPKGARSVLGKYASTTSGSTATDQALLDEVINSSAFEKTLRIVISFGGVKQSNFWSALEERLAPPLKQAGDTQALQQFEKMFDNVEWKKGLPLSFTCGRDQSLTTSIDNKEVGTIKSPNLCKALFDTYLGSNPVSPSAKESISQGLARMVTQDA